MEAPEATRVLVSKAQCGDRRALGGTDSADSLPGWTPTWPSRYGILGARIRGRFQTSRRCVHGASFSRSLHGGLVSPPVLPGRKPGSRRSYPHARPSGAGPNGGPR